MRMKNRIRSKADRKPFSDKPDGENSSKFRQQVMAYGFQRGMG